MLSLLPALTLLTPMSAAVTLNLDPAHPPVSMGGNTYNFSGYALQVLPAVVVVLRPGAPPPTRALHLGGPSWRIDVADPVAAISRALALARDPSVRAVFPDVVLPIAPAGAPSFDDPSYGGQWYLQELEMEKLYAVSLGDPSVRVAVIDSGIDIAHPDLASAVEDPYDAWSDDGDPSPNPREYCTDGSDDICDEHGTAVSGIVLARANNGDGIVGMCPQCTLVPIKLLGEGTSANTLSADVAAFEHAIADDVGVINNSWGYTTATPVPAPLAEVIHRAATEPRDGLGALVVFAAGNDDRTIRDDEVQALDDVLCVSATDSYGNPTNYTNSGAAVDIAAPSATVTIAPGDRVITNFGGTSGAAPVASGLAAWALSVDPNLSAQDLHDLLISTAVPSPFVPVDTAGHNDQYGSGNLSATGVLEALMGVADSADTKAGLGPRKGGCRCTSAPLGRERWPTMPLALAGLPSWRRRRTVR